ncbi:MAG: hypothetical protein OXE42_20070 [Gammaproteobacteria bacterium]|nr:hypothetical protein [Gammaproteobacteria bacterium]
MLLQILNGIKKRRGRDMRAIQHKLVGQAPLTDTQTGFIHHRNGFPLHYKQLRFAENNSHAEDGQGNIGLLFHSDKYLKPGTTIEATISSRDIPETIRGKVVMVRDRDDYYEIGLWLSDQEDASRARIVEQACHIEAYIKEKKFRDGPYVLNRDGAAQEWISKHAAGVPGQ